MFVLSVPPQTVHRYRRRRPDFVANQPWPTKLRPGFPKFFAPRLAARHPVGSRSLLKCTEAARPVVSSTISEVKLTDQQRPAQAPRPGRCIDLPRHRETAGRARSPRAGLGARRARAGAVWVRDGDSDPRGQMEITADCFAPAGVRLCVQIRFVYRENLHQGVGRGLKRKFRLDPAEKMGISDTGADSNGQQRKSWLGNAVRYRPASIHRKGLHAKAQCRRVSRC